MAAWETASFLHLLVHPCTAEMFTDGPPCTGHHARMRFQGSALSPPLSQILDNDTGFQGISYWLEDESTVVPFSVPSLWVTDSKIQHFAWITVNNIGDIRLSEVPASKPSGALSVMPGGALWHLPSFTDVTHHLWDEVQTPGSGIRGPLGLCSGLYLRPHLTPQMQLVN